MHIVCLDSKLGGKNSKGHIWSKWQSLNIGNISILMLNILTNKVGGYEFIKENVLVFR